MTFHIEGDPERGYTVQLPHLGAIYTLCPCCDKPFDTLRKAFLFAKNWTLLTATESREPA